MKRRIRRSATIPTTSAVHAPLRRVRRSPGYGSNPGCPCGVEGLSVTVSYYALCLGAVKIRIAAKAPRAAPGGAPLSGHGPKTESGWSVLRGNRQDAERNEQLDHVKEGAGCGHPGELPPRVRDRRSA